MANKGVFPLDASTDVGKFRLAAGDTASVPLDPPQAGFADYALWSDETIAALLVLTNGNIARAIAIAYRQIAASWASTSATIKTDDLSYSAKDSVGNWLTLADYWDRIADGQDATAVDDYFELVDMHSDHGYCPPEASPPRWPQPQVIISDPDNSLDGGTP